MKNIITFCIAILFATSCQLTAQRLARSSDEIDVVKSLISDFQKGSWEGWATHYKSDAMIYHNSWQTGTTVDDTKKALKNMLEGVTSYRFNEPLIYENARDDTGKITGVHFWAALSINREQEIVEMPMHLSFHMDEGKISGEYGFYNLSNLEKEKDLLEHHIGEFGDSMEIIRKNLEGRCSKLEERELRLLLSTAKEKQTQLECYDFIYRGKKRFVELMFSDNKLEIIHIMKTESDHEEIKAILAEKYGQPSFSSNVVDYYATPGISLRTKPHEISFVSKNVRFEYNEYMKSLE